MDKILKKAQTTETDLRRNSMNRPTTNEKDWISNQKTTCKKTPNPRWFHCWTLPDIKKKKKN